MRITVTLRIGAAAGVLALAAACGGGAESGANASRTSQPPTLPTAVLSAEDLSAWQSDVDGFVEDFNAASHDAQAAYAEFTEDAAVVDPTNSDYRIAPKSEVVSRWADFISEFPEYSARTADGYLGLAAGAYPTEVGGVPAEMGAVLDDGVLHELRVFRFAEDRETTATTLELWYRLEDAEALQSGCLLPGGCGPEVRDFVDRYLAAWSSRDETEIASLYSSEATFADSLLGIEATGADEIGILSDQRFGSASTPACSPTEIYVQTNDGDPSSSDNIGPEAGKIIGVALVYRCSLSGDTAYAIRAVSLLLFGTRPPEDVPAELDPDGLIVREEVLYNLDSLTATGIAR